MVTQIMILFIFGKIKLSLFMLTLNILVGEIIWINESYISSVKHWISDEIPVWWMHHRDNLL